ncbi:hypothetical protein D3C86_849270 [compost metagenome]
MRPKFVVDEVVILQSKDFPQCNGETIVLEVESHKEYGWVYKLAIKHHAEGYADWWKESALRKKHYPGELGFDDLMASLSSPKLLTHNP